MPELNLVLLGPPGSGKGTQGERLQEDFRLPYYATGDILRAAVRDGTELGTEAKGYMDRGDLVPDEVMVGLIAERVRARRRPTASSSTASPEPRPGRGPRLEDGRARPPLTAAILIDVSDDEVVRRLGGRRTCVKEGHIFHVEFDPAEERGHLRHLRRPAGDPRRRQARGHPQPARAPTTTRPSRWSPTTRSAGSCGGLTARGSPTTSATGSGPCSPPSGWKKSSESDRRSSGRRPSRSSAWPPRARSRPAACGCCAPSAIPASPPPSSTKPPSASSLAQDAEASFKGYRGFPGLDLRLAELDGRPRDPGLL